MFSLVLKMIPISVVEPIDVLKAPTSVNADIFLLENVGKIKTEFLADIIVIEGDSTVNN